tara:strand:+ start:11747 stop:12466 length:720 start_codon:yes stop_codon:yes gene_type:complete
LKKKELILIITNKISIVIPVFNEEKNLETLLLEIHRATLNFKSEIIIIDDNSNDNSQFVITKLKEKITEIKLIKNSSNFGQSYSIYRGVETAKYENIITIDGDGQNDPNDIDKISKIYFENTNIYLVGGIRAKRMDSNSKIIASKIANKFRSFILKDNCSDTGCSLKIFDKMTFLKIPYFNGMHRFLPALFVGLNKKTAFTNVNHRKRQYGKSKYGNFKRMVKGIFDIIRVLLIISKMK